MFSQTTEEHLHRLHVIFNRLREYNLKLKPSKCSLFKEEINYLAHHVSIVGPYWQIIKGFAWIAQPLNEHLAREGASRKLEQVLLSEHALEAFQALKEACMSAPILAFTDYTKGFLT